MPDSKSPTTVTAVAATPPSFPVPSTTTSPPTSAPRLRARTLAMRASPGRSSVRPPGRARCESVANSTAGSMPMIWAPKLRSPASDSADTSAKPMPRGATARTPGCRVSVSVTAARRSTVCRILGSSRYSACCTWA